jgi:hypothetical protein
MKVKFCCGGKLCFPIMPCSVITNCELTLGRFYNCIDASGFVSVCGGLCGRWVSETLSSTAREEHWFTVSIWVFWVAKPCGCVFIHFGIVSLKMEAVCFSETLIYISTGPYGVTTRKTYTDRHFNRLKYADKRTDRSSSLCVQFVYFDEGKLTDFMFPTKLMSIMSLPLMI